MELSIYPKPEHLPLWLLNRNSYYSYTAWRKQLWQLFKPAYFFHFELLATIKNETKKCKNLLQINLVKYSFKIPGTYKKTSRSYSHANKYKCIKLSGRQDFLHWEITRNTLSQEKFFPKIRLQVFRTSLTCFFHYLLFYFRLNNTSNKFSGTDQNLLTK